MAISAQQLTIYLYSAHRAVIFAIAQLSCSNKHTGQLLVGPNALWPTQPKFWVGHGPPGPRCSTPNVTPILRSVHWRKINERIEYKLVSLINKVLTTSQPDTLFSQQNPLLTNIIRHPLSP